MGEIERAWSAGLSRRRALARVAGLIAAAPAGAALTTAAHAQPDPRPLSAHRRVLSLPEMRTAFDFEPVFFGNVTQPVYDYTAHGDGSEFTLRRNREAFDWVDVLAARPAVPASGVDLSSDLLGVKLKYPILIAPTASQAPLHPDGEKGMFQAATAASATPMILSVNTSIPVEQVASAAPGGTLWAQLYAPESLADMRRLVGRYQDAGCTAVVVTVDQQASYYERTQQDRNLGGRVRAERAAAASAGPLTGAARYGIPDGRLWYSWPYFAEVRRMVRGPFIVKGLLTAGDALLAIEHGADAIVVSNHGGRSMDYGPSTLEVLPEIAAAVNGRVPVLFDSGVRSGADIFKALALGADAVLLGRAPRWGLGAYGAPGAQRLLEILQQDLVHTAAAAGCARLADIDATTVAARFV